jgi:hypothetical protein
MNVAIIPIDATTSLAPHSTKKMKPTDIIRFAWDNETKKKNESPQKITEKSTPERFSEVINKFNN